MKQQPTTKLRLALALKEALLSALALTALDLAVTPVLAPIAEAQSATPSPTVDSGLIPISGKLNVNGLPYTGTARFKAVITDTNGAWLWSHDGTPSSQGDQPMTAFDIEVLQGAFNFLLGKTPSMSPLSDSVLQYAGEIRIQLWVDAGQGFEAFRPFPSYPALRAANAQRLGGLPPQAYLTQNSYIPIDNTNIVEKISSGNLAAFSDKTNTFTFGSPDSKRNKSIVVLAENGRTPTIRYNVEENHWEVSNNGKTFSRIGSTDSFDGEGSTSAVDLDSSEVKGVLPISHGGTGAATPASARKALGLEIGVDISPLLKHNFSATQPPEATNDSSEGYSPGSLWFDTQAERTYVAVSVEEASALWRAITSTPGMTEIADGSVTEQKLASGAVTTDKIAANAVTGEKIAPSTVTDDHLTASGVVPGSYTYASITVDEDGRITSASSNAGPQSPRIGDANPGPAFTDEVSNGTSLIYEGPTVDTFETRLTFQGDPTADSTVVIPNVSGTLVTTADTGTVSSSMLANEAVTAAKIQPNAVGSVAIANGSIVAQDIATDTITANQIGPNAIGASELASTGVTAGTYTLPNLTIDQDGRVTSASTGIISSSAVTAIGDAGPGSAFANDVINGTQLIYEGTTIDAFDTRLRFSGNPTTNSIVTIPNVTGTIVTTGDTGTVTSTMITDGTITNTDLSSSASIAFSKLQSLPSGNIIVGNSSNVATAVAMSGGATLSNTGVLTLTSSSVGSSQITDGSITSADIADRAVASVDIADGTIANADISGSAAIAFSKLASLTSTNILVGNASNVATAVAVSGDATLGNTGVLTITSNAIGSAEITDGTVASADITDGTVSSTDILDGTITNTDISSSAAIAYTKLAALPSANTIVGNASGVPTAMTFSGDATLSNTGVVTLTTDSIGSSELTDGSIANIDISASAAISFSKLAALTSGNILVGNASNVATSVAMSGDATISNTGVVTIASNAVGSAEITDGTVASADILDGTVSTTDITDATITNTDINASAGIAFSKLASLTSTNILVGNASNVAAAVAMSGDGTLSNTGVLTISSNAVGSAEITDASIANADISGSAAIAFSKLAALPSTNLLVGNGSNVATAVAMSGDATLSNTGVLTVADNSVDGTDITFTSESTGDMLSFNGTDWVRLAPGAAGTVLSGAGAGSTPTWVAPSSTTGSLMPDPVASRRTSWIVPTTTNAVTLDQMGITAPTIFNAGSAQPSTTRMFVRYPTTTTLNNDGGFNGPYTTTRLDHAPVVTSVVRTDPTTIANTRLHVGLAAASVGGVQANASGASATAFVSIAYDSSSTLSTTNWLCCSGDATNFSCSNTGVAVTAATEYQLTIDASAITSLTCTVNGTSVSKSTNLPGSTVSLGVFLGVRTLTTAVRNLDFAKLSLLQN